MLDSSSKWGHLLWNGEERQKKWERNSKAKKQQASIKRLLEGRLFRK
jgi:hypothetical protein